MSKYLVFEPFLISSLNSINVFHQLFAPFFCYFEKVIAEFQGVLSLTNSQNTSFLIRTFQFNLFIFVLFEHAFGHFLSQVSGSTVGFCSISQHFWLLSRLQKAGSGNTSPLFHYTNLQKTQVALLSIVLMVTKCCSHIDKIPAFLANVSTGFHSLFIFVNAWRIW